MRGFGPGCGPWVWSREEAVVRVSVVSREFLGRMRFLSMARESGLFVILFVVEGCGQGCGILVVLEWGGFGRSLWPFSRIPRFLSWQGS